MVWVVWLAIGDWTYFEYPEEECGPEYGWIARG